MQSVCTAVPARDRGHESHAWSLCGWRRTCGALQGEHEHAAHLRSLARSPCCPPTSQYSVARGNNSRLILGALRQRFWWHPCPEGEPFNLCWRPYRRRGEIKKLQMDSKLRQCVNHFEFNDKLCSKQVRVPYVLVSVGRALRCCAAEPFPHRAQLHAVRARARLPALPAVDGRAHGGRARMCMRAVAAPAAGPALMTRACRTRSTNASLGRFALQTSSALHRRRVGLLWRCRTPWGRRAHPRRRKGQRLLGSRQETPSPGTTLRRARGVPAMCGS